jgi:TPR repeat protein
VKKILLVLAMVVCALYAKSDMELAEEAFDKGEYKTSAQYFTKACEAGNGEACWAIGSFHNTGSGVKLDHTKAAKFLTRGCELDNAESCYNIAAMYYDPIGLKQDYSKAFTYFSKACTLDHGRSCYILGICMSMDLA